MELARCAALLGVLAAGWPRVHAGGHGGKHHDHLNIHVPKFIHHDFHTKVITIHHHHHKPKKEHHHHHHHHHKPHMHHTPHYHHHHKTHHKTLKKTTVSKKHHGHHGHHAPHGHHKHHGHHGHHGHDHGHHHHEYPTTNYDPSPVYNTGPSYSPTPVTYEEQHFEPFYGAGGVPKVHGFTHTVKQVKVFDSLPGVLAGNSPGYEVTEDGEDNDDFSNINSIQQSYPATFGYVTNFAPDLTSNDPFASLASPSTAPSASQNPFQSSPQPSAAVVGTQETITGPVQQHDPFAVSGPTLNSGLDQGSPVSGFRQEARFGEAESFAGTSPAETYFNTEDKGSGDSAPVSFAREAGFQHSIQTGGHQTIVY